MTAVAVAAWTLVAAAVAAQGQSAATTAQSPPVPPVVLKAEFDSREIKTTAEAGADVVEFCFGFTNTGEVPLAVEGFSQSCGCMKGEWDGVPVAPGAKGRITAKLLTKGLRGNVRKSLHVKFFEGGSVELVGEVEIPEALTYSAQTLRWSIGDALESKQVDIEVMSKAPLRVLSVVANDPAFACELQSIGEARYRIVITPRDTTAERICVLQVRTDSKDPRDALKGLFALVEKPKLKGGAP